MRILSLMLLMTFSVEAYSEVRENIKQKNGSLVSAPPVKMRTNVKK